MNPCCLNHLNKLEFVLSCLKKLVLLILDLIIIIIIIIIINHIYIAPIQNTSFYGTLHKTKLSINFIIKITLNLRHNYD